jgi:hypothetical protein
MSLIERVRSLCLALPETFERETWDHPTFRVGSGRGKIFCTAAPDGSTITVKADPVEREALLGGGGIDLGGPETHWEVSPSSSPPAIA